ncbi:hypothetical protein ORI20_30520 [Mycobacterium sp. CVI_P3]|uniref:Uncharacterized protein n=1 Tax=Mycobacterium pinniadriaticum TaxID=2994102 RepID=A0ABT3SND3_9MYCO|nr:hypothetical protein [Mycobacterium pinniadriaticum]MCX2934607.1 hypothetical protein [Mycobacterium pinniadriaticum]MCX2941030.1 hypothetical protein [Mycobacterium pinniadriaticum]
MTTAVATKFQVGTAALALAAAASLPAIAQAAPSLGGAATASVDSVVIPSASATTSCTPGALGCYLVEGAVAGTQALVRGVVIYVGTVAYVLVDGTGEILKFVGGILPGPVGDFFDNVGDGVLAFGNTIAETFHVGPYLV